MSKELANIHQSPCQNIAVSATAVSENMRQSLAVVMKWQDTASPPRFSIGSGNIRKLTNCVREQPANFMIIIHKSTETAEKGLRLCDQGKAVSMILLGEDNLEKIRMRDKTNYVEGTLDEIKTAASELKRHTCDIQDKFRLLRVIVFKLHKDLNEVNEGERSAFLARLSRLLSKDVRNCEDALRKICDNLQEVEDSLNLINRWWLEVEAKVKILQWNGQSKLASAHNQITLEQIKKGFEILDKYFHEYIHEMRILYDQNVPDLNSGNQKYLKKLKDCSELVVSDKAPGRLEPAKSET